MQLSPEEVEDDDYESESAAPTPLASSFPVPPAFPTLPSSLGISLTNANAKTTLTPNPINEVQLVAGSIKREAVVAEKESDDEGSLCSESYYSARSSFSSERDGVR
jgi:hypothetical protein